MPVHSFNHFNIRAPQPLLDEVKDFYVNVIGLKVGWRPPFSFPGHWLYLGDSAVVHLVESPAGAPEPDNSEAALNHVAFTCTGLAEIEARLQEVGVEYRKATVPGTTQQQLFVKDPSGIGIEFSFASADA